MLHGMKAFFSAVMTREYVFTNKCVCSVNKSLFTNNGINCIIYIPFFPVPT